MTILNSVEEALTEQDQIHDTLMTLKDILTRYRYAGIPGIEGIAAAANEMFRWFAGECIENGGVLYFIPPSSNGAGDVVFATPDNLHILDLIDVDSFDFELVLEDVDSFGFELDPESEDSTGRPLTLEPEDSTDDQSYDPEQEL